MVELQEKKEEDGTAPLQIPMRKTKHGFAEYSIEYLKPDQQEVVALAMSKIHEWLHCKDHASFRPLRLTVMGGGGSGKSIVINTIVTQLRRMFQLNGVVRVAAPTGTAAFNVGGETFYHLTSSRPTRTEYIAHQLKGNKAKREKLIRKFKHLLALLVDERSLVKLGEIGTASQMIAETVHNGGPSPDGDFGGIPVVILFGDDYQLPATGEGALQCLREPKSAGKMTLEGRRVILDCAKQVIELKGSKRIQGGKKDDKKLIEAIRKQKNISEMQVKRLLNLTARSLETRIGRKAKEALEHKSIHLFYTNDKRNRHNIRQLAKHSSKEKPVAFVKCRSHSNTTGKADSRHFDSEAPTNVMLSEGATVALDGRNFYPEWGLHNGACGKIIEIAFDEGCSPNRGGLPRYVVVDFPLYKGPAWDIRNKTHVPIPQVELNCNHRCCTRTFIPLALSYARTIHKFQGQSAGPVDDWQIPNMLQCIFCDPDRREREGTALGLFYTAISRATTLGDKSGNNSAIYFTGEDFDEVRIRNIGRMKRSDDDYRKVQDRAIWVEYLENNKLSREELEANNEALQWARSAQISKEHLEITIKAWETAMKRLAKPSSKESAAHAPKRKRNQR